MATELVDKHLSLPAKLGLWLEMLLLFVGLPTLYYFRLMPVHFIVPMSLLSIGAVIYLYRHHGFNNRSFGLNGFQNWRSFLLAGTLYVAISIAIVYWFFPENLFIIVRERPQLWLLIMCFYPIFSALPQEILFRGFFMQRYAPLFEKQWQLIVVNGILFGLAHLMFGHWVSVILSAVGGFYLANQYLQHRSILLSAILHGILGNWIFTVGLGHFFYLAGGK
ncbi:MAG: CPBP family intramembrane glutamic endopeptidase [Chitinophagales bacterium]|nr:CPBP family intramembrane glutamic endopeptidase [Chitinophagales bacterium]